MKSTLQKLYSSIRSISRRAKAEWEEVAMKIISHAWRSYKSKLMKIWRDQDTPFDKYKDLSKEDWVRFVEKCKSEHFGTNSQYMQWL
jgi:hypothetical protein